MTECILSTNCDEKPTWRPVDNMHMYKYTLSNTGRTPRWPGMKRKQLAIKFVLVMGDDTVLPCRGLLSDASVNLAVSILRMFKRCER